MEIHHDKKNQRAWTEIDSSIAEVRYELNEGKIDIFHTYVPESLEGHRIASRLVEFIYNYAREEGLEMTATCSYANHWLKKHNQNNKQSIL
jgi:predicted GNAT family acetyltransferase